MVTGLIGPCHPPIGKTRFQFPVAILTFWGDGHQCLVTAGVRAQYKGAGTVNMLKNRIVGTQWNQILDKRTGPGGVPWTDDNLLIGDWSRDPAGTGETGWVESGNDRLGMKTGLPAESWEFPEPDTVVFHIRKGVHFALNPANEASRLVGGREVTADDVSFSLNKIISHPRSYIYRSNPLLRDADITALDKYTVQIKVPAAVMAQVMTRLGDGTFTVAPEIWEKYNGDDSDWKFDMHVGTGPYMVVDQLPGSIVIFERNPNYFLKNPVGPGKGDQLPYLDGIRLMIIPDTSTQEAAFRTGKVDWMDELANERVHRVLKTDPRIKFTGFADEPINIATATFREPFGNIRVRQALQMALDIDTVIETMYGGDRAVFNKGFLDPVAGIISTPDFR